MLMELLFAERAEMYLRQAAAAGTGPCIFVHVPKTAGTSLRAEIASFLTPEVNITVDYRDTTRSFHLRMDDAVTRFLEGAALRPVRFASGHILARHVEQIREALPDARFVTLLRDPVERVVSDYRYQRSPRHPLHREFAARVPTLADYVALKPEANKMATHLAPAPVVSRGDAAGVIHYVLRRFLFVGLQDLYPLCFRTLTTILGSPRSPSLRENVNDGTGPEGEAQDREVTPELASRIRAANPLDVALYEHFDRGYRVVQAQLARHLPPS